MKSFAWLPYMRPSITASQAGPTVPHYGPARTATLHPNDSYVRTSIKGLGCDHNIPSRGKETGYSGMSKLGRCDRLSVFGILQSNPWKIAAVFSLVALENVLLLSYPIFAGYAINSIIAGNALSAATYAGVVLSFWLVGASRRAVDTRVYTEIYAKLAVSVALDQRNRGEDISTSAARVTLSREFIEFFDKHMPVLVTTVFSIFGASLMLIIIEIQVGLATAVILTLSLIWLPGFSRKNELLHERLNNRLEREIALVSNTRRATLLRHYRSISVLRVSLSDREAFAYILIGSLAAGLFLFSFIKLSAEPNINPGHVYAVITYIWTFVSSLDETPTLVDQIARLKNIGKRISK